MAKLARIVPAVALACPACQVRLSDVPLDRIAAGEGYDCPHCGQAVRIPAPVLQRLIEQRDALPPEEDEGGEGSGLTGVFAYIIAVFKRLWS